MTWGEKQYINIDDVIDILSMFDESIKELDGDLYYGSDLSGDSYVEGGGIRRFSPNSILLRGISSTLDGYIEKLRYSSAVKSESQIVREHEAESNDILFPTSAESSE